MYYVQLDSGTVLETADVSLWPEAKRLPSKKGKQLMKDEAIAQLHEILRPGDTVYTVLRHVSRSGMFRKIDLYKLVDGDRVFLSGLAARAMGINRRGADAIPVSGCGMDMGFHLVYELAYTLFPHGFACVGKGCPSNDHFNRDERKHHPDGGYALHHKWL